jgi:hypothetical protein
MRALLVSVTMAAALAACSPPAQQDAGETTAPPPTVVACNTVAPDLARQVRVEEELATVASADLRGGAITPGTYDLTSARRVGAARGWSDTRAVALEVSEAPTGGVTFNWAGAAPNGQVDTWTASFTDTPEARLTYTCGRMGEVSAGFTASGDELQLRLPDGADGSLHLVFARRA